MTKHVRWNLVLALTLATCLGFSQAATASPVNLPGLKIWLRSDAGTVLSGDLVTGWNDQSGAGNNAGIHVAPPRLVAGQFNGKPVVRFEGGQGLAASTGLSLNRWTIFVVARNNNPVETYGMILGPGDSSTNNQFRFENGSQILTFGGSNGMPVVYSSVGNTRDPHLLVLRYDGANLQVTRDGVLKNTSAFVTSGPWLLGKIGSWFSSCGSCFLKGDIAEIIIYDRALTDIERASVDGYLRGKYELP